MVRTHNMIERDRIRVFNFVGMYSDSEQSFLFFPVARLQLSTSAHLDALDREMERS